MKKLLLSMFCALGLLTANAATVTDVITIESIKSDANFSATSTSYAEFTVKGTSGAEYALQCAHNKGTYLQFRTTNNNSGLVTTKSAGTVVSVAIEYNSQTTDRIMNVYGSSTAYTAPADLYATGVNNAGQIQAGTDNLTYTFASQPSYVGLRSSNGSIYIEKITIVWDTEGTPGGGNEGDDPVVTPPAGDEASVAFYAGTTAQPSGYTATCNIAGTLVGEGAQTFTAGDITMAFTKVNSSASNVNGAQVRWYQGDIMTLTPANGATITKVVISAASGYAKDLTASTGSATIEGNTITWTGSASAPLTLTTTAQVRFTTAIVTYTTGKASAVAAPVISCENNMVSITCATEGASIYYDLEGNNPTNNSMPYTAAFPITKTVTVKAIAYKGSDVSAVTTYQANYIGTYEGFADYVADNPTAGGTVNGPITAIYQNGRNTYLKDSKGGYMLAYASGAFTMPALNNGDQLASISGTYSPYSGLPEMVPTAAGNLTTGGAAVQPTEITLEEVAEDALNAYVVIKNVTIGAPNGDSGAASRTYPISDESGELVIYNTFYDDRYYDVVDVPSGEGFTVTGFICINNGNLQITPISITDGTAMEKVANPVFNPASGAVEAGTEVTITCETLGASIYYTIDGSVPSVASTLYTAPIVINEAMKISAIAVMENNLDSDVITANYTILDKNASQATFDFTDPANYDLTAEEGKTEIDLTGKTLTSGPIHLLSEAADGASTKPRLFQSQGNWTYRFYKDNTITISADANYAIKAIKFTGTNLNNESVVYSDNGTFSGSDSEWVANTADGVQSMTITKTATGNNPTISTIVVTYNIKTGVNDILVNDENAPVEYYNLQGVRVDNPVRGQLYIVRQGKNVSKVIL